MTEGGEKRRSWLTRGVASVGLASFFSDFGHEIATALLPAFVTTVLHGSAGALGLIEGGSDALTGIAKLVGGPRANDAPRRRRMATGGYLVTAAATGALGVVVTVWQAAVLRAIAWAARGIRSPARDSLLASLAPEDSYGRAYGLERAGDNMGAVAGPLLAAALVTGFTVRTSIYFSAIPGVLAALAIGVAANEARRLPPQPAQRARLGLSELREARVLAPLLPIACFELGNMATTLLILRATHLLESGGRSFASATSIAVFIYAAHNLSGSLVAYGGGQWIDRANPRVVFGTGAALYVVAYGGFAANLTSWPMLLLAFLIAGAGIGLAETAESTLVAHLAPDHLRGSAFGLLGGVQSFGDFTSSAAVGLLWTFVSPTAGFIYAAVWMVAAVLASASIGCRPSSIGKLDGDGDEARQKRGASR